MDTSAWAWATAAFAALAGLVAGSCVIALIAWLPGAEPGSRLAPRRCPRCGTGLRAADLVPVTGWLGLRERCCASREVSWGWWLAVGLITAGVLAALALRFGPSPVLPAFCYLGVVGVALAFIDARHRRLPDALTLPSYPAALLLLGAGSLAVPGGAHRFLVALLGMAAAWLLFVIQALIYPAGIGWGDVKLSGVLGLYLGWLGVRPLVAGLFLGYLLAATAGVALLAARRASRKSLVPFGPFLLAGTLIAIMLSGPGGPLR